MLIKRLLRFVLPLFIAASANAAVRLPAIISDNMVLQQGIKVRIWGSANAGEHVAVTFDKKTSNIITDAQGRWQVLLGPLRAGGPFELTVKGDNVLIVKNVLIGEVWLCSGQSNMEWPLVNTTDGAETVARANHSEIRLFTVEKHTAASPLTDVEGHWVVTTPEEAAHFSAVGYFFGRELYEHLKVPIGLIHSSWGGTPAEAWTSNEALRSSPELKPILDRYESSLNALPQTKAAYAQALAQWEEKNLYLDGENKGEALGYAETSVSTAGWSQMELPQQIEAAGLMIDGAIWFRKVIELPTSWSGKDLVLNLTPIDDYDITYFNGVKIGATGRETPNSYAAPRKYVVPASTVRSGRNVIAVRVFDSAGEGGFNRSGLFSIGPAGAVEPISLRGTWDYKVELALEPKHPDWGTRPEAVGATNQNNPSVLYLSLIHISEPTRLLSISYA